MNSGESVNVYAEAKSEYTRQLCQILTPSLQLYFIDSIKVIKEKEADSRRLLWNFQAFLQEIPDWNQDKVIRETEKIQKESNCDYLEELLTAVFIAHTKVLSAIRITTKQKKLQLTIPKIDHFLHRTLRETGRILWGNAFLFAEQGTAIERQKNMRQIEGLIMDGIQQSIRSLLPVKAILKEYLNDDDEEAGEEQEANLATATTATTATAALVSEEPAAPEAEAGAKSTEAIQPVEQPLLLTIPEAPIPTDSTALAEATTLASTEDKEEDFAATAAATATATATATAPTTIEHTISVETEPSVSFTNRDTVFDFDNPDENEITDSNADDELYEVDHLEVLNQPPEPMDEYEELEPSNKIEFEEIQV